MTLDADTFTFVADLVRSRSAIQLAAGKEYLVESRLLPLARRAGAGGVDDYIRCLRRSPDHQAYDAVVEALTTNETSWFRDAQPFTALRERLLGELSTARGPASPLRIWSAACSTGQEPYSIAMTVLEALGATATVRILATDLSEQALARARAGRYSQLEVNRGLPAAMLVKYFTRVGTDWEVSSRLRTMVTFTRHNLLSPLPAGRFDLVLLRNVLIYFDLATKQDILRRLRSSVRPGGYLLLGAAETTIGVDDAWERVPLGGGSAYRLPLGGTA